MSTYIESALADFIKSILTRGIRTLKSPRFFPYTAFLLLIVIIGTLTAFYEDLSGKTLGDDYKDRLLYIEISVSIAFIAVGILLGRASTTLQMGAIMATVVGLASIFEFGSVFDDPVDFGTKYAGIMYIFWIAIATFSTFALIRDLFASETFGTILFLGKPLDDGEVMFKWICFLLAIINFSLGYLVYTKSGISDSEEFTALIIMLSSIIALIPLVGFQRKNDVFFTVISWFYMFSTVRVFLLAFQTLSDSTGETSYWDTLFSIFIALYTIQNATAKGVRLGQKTDDQPIEEELLERQQGMGIARGIGRILSDRGIVLVILGIVLGFHTMQVQTLLGRETIFQDFELTSDADIVLLGYEVNLVISLLIYVASLAFFIIFPPFRRYAGPEVNRIPWAPPYDDLKLVIAGIKDGEVSWKGDAMKFIIGVGKDKIAQKFGRKRKSVGERFTSSWGGLLGRSRKKKDT
ncbi:MAG: hypothetical protein ACW98K_09760 [Candidatus Kariarchaeaceae archaeon]|jgi:hypothetical protein